MKLQAKQRLEASLSLEKLEKKINMAGENVWSSITEMRKEDPRRLPPAQAYQYQEALGTLSDCYMSLAKVKKILRGTH